MMNENIKRALLKKHFEKQGIQGIQIIKGSKYEKAIFETMDEYSKMQHELKEVARILQEWLELIKK